MAAMQIKEKDKLTEGKLTKEDEVESNALSKVSTFL